MKKIAIIALPIFVVALLSAVLAKHFLFTQKRSLDFNQEKSVTIDDGGLNYKINTKAKTIGELIGTINPNLSEKDEIIPARETAVFPGMQITIHRQAKVKIVVDGQNLEKDTLKKTVSEVLVENEIFLSPHDELKPAPETNISNGLEIKITRKNTEEITEEEPIEFSETTQKDSKVDWGVKEISQKGEEGVRETTYKVDYENGKEIKRVKLSSKITKKPITQIVKTGTKIKVGKSDSGIASWYNAGINECASRDHAPGTWLRVTNTQNGKQVFVKVAGYGPQKGTGKLIDLDNKAFKQIAPLGQGVVKVKVEEVLNKGFKPDQS